MKSIPLYTLLLSLSVVGCSDQKSKQTTDILQGQTNKEQSAVSIKDADKTTKPESTASETPKEIVTSIQQGSLKLPEQPKEPTPNPEVQLTMIQQISRAVNQKVESETIPLKPFQILTGDAGAIVSEQQLAVYRKSYQIAYDKFTQINSTIVSLTDIVKPEEVTSIAALTTHKEALRVGLSQLQSAYTSQQAALNTTLTALYNAIPYNPVRNNLTSIRNNLPTYTKIYNNYSQVAKQNYRIIEEIEKHKETITLNPLTFKNVVDATNYTDAMLQRTNFLSLLNDNLLQLKKLEATTNPTQVGLVK